MGSVNSVAEQGKEAEKTVISQGMLKSNIAVVYGTKTSVREGFGENPAH